MSLETFLELTPAQFSTAYAEFLNKIEADRRHSELTRWQVARWQVWRTLAPPQKKQISVRDLIELPGDEAVKKEATQSTPERFEELKKKWADG